MSLPFCIEYYALPASQHLKGYPTCLFLDVAIVMALCVDDSIIADDLLWSTITFQEAEVPKRAVRLAILFVARKQILQSCSRRLLLEVEEGLVGRLPVVAAAPQTRAVEELRHCHKKGSGLLAEHHLAAVGSIASTSWCRLRSHHTQHMDLAHSAGSTVRKLGRSLE